MTKITKAVIPVAGYGTRFLPWTKTLPKEMVPIIDRPLLHYLVEDLIASGIETVVFVTSGNKKALEDYFDRNPELEAKLKQTGKTKELEAITELTEKANFVFVRQHQQLGNGHAILQGRPITGNEPFIFAWGDEIVETKPPIFKQLIDAYAIQPGNYMSLLKAPEGKIDDWCQRYGNAQIKQLSNGIYQIEKVVEKPGVGNSLSPYFTVGGFITEPEYMDALAQAKPDKGDEIWWNSQMDKFVAKGKVYGKIIKGDYWDMGNPLGFLTTNIHFALKNPEYKKEIVAQIENEKL